MPKKKKAKVKIHRVVKLKPDTHLVELEVAGTPPPDCQFFDEPVVTKPKKGWFDWLAEKIVGV